MQNYPFVIRYLHCRRCRRSSVQRGRWKRRQPRECRPPGGRGEAAVRGRVVGRQPRPRPAAAAIPPLPYPKRVGGGSLAYNSPVPELPEIEVLRRSLEPHLLHERVLRADLREPRLRERVRPRELASLAGLTIRALGRRSKYLLIHLDDSRDSGSGRTLVVHLGMSGRLTLTNRHAHPEPHEHVVLHLASGRALRFRDPRRFGLLRVIPTSRLHSDPHFAALGLEPLAADTSSTDLTGAALERAARGRRGPVKSFLMDAGVVVGVGNIYATESLFRAGIHPRRSVARLSPARWERLAQAVVAVLRQAIGQGGTTLNDFADGEGRSGYFQVSLSAYGREGEPCLTCATPIRRIVQSGRSTYYCPRCQR
jgi:formamidopyrimidine-DNA glycosylase